MDGLSPPRHAWLTAERLELYSRALLLALAVSVVLAIVTAQGSGTATGRLGGDLPAFYGAGRLVWEGRVAELYDWTAQRQAQVGLHPPGEEGRFLAFAYPPFFAACYAPLAALDYVTAYAVHTAVMTALVGVGVLALRGVLPRVAAHPVPALAGCLAVLPLFRAVTGGQNTAVTFALLALAWRAAHDGRDRWLGVWLGLMLFKPQLALPVIGLVALRRRWGMWPTLFATAALLYLAGAALGGWGWPGWWWGQIAGFHALDQDVNAPNSVGFLGVAEAVFGVGHPAAVGLGGGAVVGVVLGAVVAWWQGWAPSTLRWGAVAVVAVLVPPHAMVYDSGLVALAWLAWADARGRAGLSTLVALYAVHLATPFARALGVNPMFAVLVATLVVLVRARAPERGGAVG